MKRVLLMPNGLRVTHSCDGHKGQGTVVGATQVWFSPPTSAVDAQKISVEVNIVRWDTGNFTACLPYDLYPLPVITRRERLRRWWYR